MKLLKLNQSEKEDVKKTFYYVIGLGIVFLVFIFLITASWIGYAVEERCRIAQEKYKGDCVDSLVGFLDDESNDFRSRNSAIWALGQLGDKRAQPVLEKYYTGNIPEREPLAKTISQYELKKALKLVKGGKNISGFVWKD